MADILNEIKSDIRHEQYIKLIRNYGKYAVVALIVIILIVGGVQWLRDSKHRAAAKSGAALHEALAYLEEKNQEAAMPILDKLAQEGTDGYAALTKLHKASLLVKEGKQQDAIALYQNITISHSDNAPIRDLAELLSLHLRIEQKNIDPEIETRLQALAGQERPWRFFAQEVLALYLLHVKQEKDSARNLLSQLSADPAAPTGIRSRASILLETLGTI